MSDLCSRIVGSASVGTFKDEGVRAQKEKPLFRRDHRFSGIIRGPGTRETAIFLPTYKPDFMRHRNMQLSPYLHLEYMNQNSCVIFTIMWNCILFSAINICFCITNICITPISEAYTRYAAISIWSVQTKAFKKHTRKL